MTPADRAAAAAARPSGGTQSCRAAGASVSPAGRRRHSGAQRSPLPIVPRTPTAFPSVVGRGGGEPPARPSPPPQPQVAGAVGVASQRSKVGSPGSPGGRRGAQASGSITPARLPGAGAAAAGRRSWPPRLRAHPHPHPHPHPSALLPCPVADSGACTAAQARGKLRDVCGRAGEWFLTGGGGGPDRPGGAEGPRVEGHRGLPGVRAGGFRFALPLPEGSERVRRRVCVRPGKTFCCPGARAWWGGGERSRDVLLSRGPDWVSPSHGPWVAQLLKSFLQLAGGIVRVAVKTEAAPGPLVGAMFTEKHTHSWLRGSRRRFLFLLCPRTSCIILLCKCALF